MAEFKKLIITTKGQALMAKLMSGTATIQFTKIAVSDTAYNDSQLEGLTSLSGIKQTAAISKIIRTNNVAVQVEGAVTNTDLSSGYYMRTIGLYALDPDDGEILYAVTNASQAGYMPPYNGITVSGAFFKLVTTVSNADNVTLEVDPGAVATIGDIQDLQQQISDLQAFVGYTDDDIYGVEVDFVNRKFTRLAGAVNRTPGAGFDDIKAFGGRKRCILTDDGVVLAYHGEPGYTETGALTQEIVIELEPAKGEDPAVTETYPVGTKVQVMVEQPKFYYKVVPLQLEKVEGGKGFHMRKARYYVSDTMKAGFKLHPAFIHKGKEKDFIYLSAYEGCTFDVSTNTYNRTDEQNVDFTTATGDKLSSIAGAKPTSGVEQTGATRNGFRKLANNRGIGWEQAFATTVALTQLLFTVEYASMNTQTAIGRGNVDKPSGDANISYTEITGATTHLGNQSGSVTNENEINIVTYRGEENFWGNIWKWVDGLNIFNQSDLYVANHGFADDTNQEPYKDAGITLSKTNGYISAFGYNEEFDWLFFPSETKGDSALPVGDNFYQTTTLNAWRVALLGGIWYGGSSAGGFCWYVHIASSYRHRDIGGRLVYVPDAA